MVKKRWEEPKLIVLVRSVDVDNENILAACKNVSEPVGIYSMPSGCVEPPCMLDCSGTAGS